VRVRVDADPLLLKIKQMIGEQYIPFIVGE
jgi:hypothetical protein